MRKLFNVLIVIALLCSSCAKEVLKPVEVDLGKKTVGVEAGCFPVKVTADCVWYAESDCPWIHVDSEFHAKEGTFTINYDSNASSEGDWRFNRVGKVLIKTYDDALVGTVAVWQKGISPVIAFDESNKISVSGGQCKVPCRTNLTDAERSRIVVTADQKWISDLRWSLDGRSVDFTAEAGSSRQAVITLAHTDAWGIVTEVLCNISQEE